MCFVSLLLYYNLLFFLLVFLTTVDACVRSSLRLFQLLLHFPFSRGQLIVRSRGTDMVAHLGADLVLYEKLQKLGIGETVVPVVLLHGLTILLRQLHLVEFALVQRLVLFTTSSEVHPKHTGTVVHGLQGNGPERPVKRLQKLLEVPERTVLPLALGTVLYGNLG